MLRIGFFEAVYIDADGLEHKALIAEFGDRQRCYRIVDGKRIEVPVGECIKLAPKEPDE